MAVVDIKNLEGKNVGQIELPDAVFGAKVNPNLLHETVRWYQAAQRAGTHKTKGRGEVSGSGKKLWKQKGTGRARVGSIRSSIWRKGGTVHGPVPRSYAYRLPRKMVLGALRSALSAKLAEQKLTVVDAWQLESHKTQAVPRRRSARLDGDDEDHAARGDCGEPQSGTCQPQSRRREAGRSARPAAVRFAAARPAGAFERRGRASRRDARIRAARRGACFRSRNDRSGKAGRASRQGCEARSLGKESSGKESGGQKAGREREGQEVSERVNAALQAGETSHGVRVNAGLKRRTRP